MEKELYFELIECNNNNNNNHDYNDFDNNKKQHSSFCSFKENVHSSRIQSN